MTEIAKCQCGARAHLQGHVDDVDGEFVSIACYDGKCGWTSPWRRTEPEAIAAWNDLMRPRPVAEWDIFPVLHDLRLRHLSLGRVSLGPNNKWFASCFLTGEHSFGLSIDDARAWLVERVRAAGFDVKGGE